MQLQGSQEAHELIVGALAGEFGVCWRCLCQSFLLESQIGIEIDLSGLDRLVTQPQRDDRTVDAGLQQFHGRRVPAI
jgi:hypothetical protein